MTLEYLDSIYKQIFSQGYSGFIIYAKALATIIIIIQLSLNLYRSFSRTGQIFTERESDGFSPYELLRGLGLILLIIFSTQVLDLFDSIMVDIETVALSSISDMKESFHLSFVPDAQDLKDALVGVTNDAKEDNTTGILKNILRIVNYFNPLTWIGGAMSWALNFILSIVDMFVYPFFLSKRYFILGIIKLFFPLIIAFSIFEKFRDFTTQILKLYARTFLAIIPMIFASFFIDYLYVSINDIMWDSVGSAAAMTVAGPLIQMVAIIVAVVLKISLFKQSFTLMDKIIP